MDVETVSRERAYGELSQVLTLPLLEATRAAALACQEHFGKGDNKAADRAAVDAMRRALRAVPGEGAVVIGEGEKDEAPMLYNGETFGAGGEPRYDVAVDPLEGTKFTARGLAGAISVIAASGRGALWSPGPGFYMEKIVVGPRAKGAIDLQLGPEENLKNVADALGRKPYELRVFVMDKPRHQKLIDRIRGFGASVIAPPDGDVAGSLEALLPGGEVDVLMGIGGTPEGVITACAASCLGGDMQGRLAPQSERERAAIGEAGLSPEQIFRLEDLVCGESLFVATGVSGGCLRRPWKEHGAYRTDSLVLSSGGRIVRVVESTDEREE